MREDNDLVVIPDEAAAAKFDGHFERMWDDAEPMIEFGPAIQALERSDVDLAQRSRQRLSRQGSG